jgi:hypothetical protein
MNTPIDHEKAFFNWFLTKPQYLKTLNRGFFSNPDVDVLAQVAKDFFLKFGEAPSNVQMKALVKDRPQEISDDIVESVYDKNISSYEQDWLKRTAE